jgi:hypothetical protein
MLNCPYLIVPVPRHMHVYTETDWRGIELIQKLKEARWHA